MFSTRKPLLPRGKISISSQRLAAKAVCAQVSCPDTQTGTGDAPLFSCLSKRKGEEKRTTQEGEDFDFFPLLTPLIETMKEGDTPSFKSPLRCTEKEAFFLRTSFPAGDRGLPLPGAEEGRTQSPQPRRFARPSPLGEGRKRHSRQGGLAAAAPVSLRGAGE